MGKEADIEKLKTATMQLTQDLHNANVMRQSFQDEIMKTRNDMRMQMEKLRSNMSAIMQNGAEDSKVVQIQNDELIQQLNSVTDELALVQTSKKHSDQEALNLRAELQRYRDEIKMFLEENSMVKSQSLKYQQQLQNIHIEITQLTAKICVLEKDLEETHEQYREKLLAKDNENEVLRLEHLLLKQGKG